MAVVLAAGCSFNVMGTNGGDPAGGTTGTPSPTQSVPDVPDLGGPSTTPPSSAPDMAAQRIGTACTTDAQCDPGLFCAKTFGIGDGRIDIPGGYCTHECSMSACPSTSFCAPFTFGKYCLSSCPPDPCRASYICCDVGGGQKGCATDSLCSAVPHGKGG